jgi:purine-binding chemotaxis protein CheW
MSEGQTYILFGVAGTTYAVPSQHVLHMEMVDHVTPVPNAPAFVEGVVFSRGEVVPVINLRARFGFERTALDLRTRLLVVQANGRRVGLMADDAREFIVIPDSSIRPRNDAIGGLSGNYLEGVATLGERIVLVLDIREVVEPISSAVA